MWWTALKTLAKYLWPATVSWWFLLLAYFGLTKLAEATSQDPIEPFSRFVKFGLTTSALAWAAGVVLATAWAVLHWRRRSATD